MRRESCWFDCRLFRRDYPDHGWLCQFARNAEYQNQNTRVTIVGHTDNSGSDAINNPLSFNHAASTRDYLVSRGVSSARISIDGRGSHEPVAANDNPENMARNRRVEIFVAEPKEGAPR